MFEAGSTGFLKCNFGAVASSSITRHVQGKLFDLWTSKKKNVMSDALTEQSAVLVIQLIRSENHMPLCSQLFFLPTNGS